MKWTKEVITVDLRTDADPTRLAYVSMGAPGLAIQGELQPVQGQFDEGIVYHLTADGTVTVTDHGAAFLAGTEALGLENAFKLHGGGTARG